MEVDREDGRSPNQLRPLSCSRNLLNRAHGSASWSQGDTKVLAAVFGPKAGQKKNENPEKACIEVIWKPKTGQSGKLEKEFEMILKRTLQSICILTINPNTTTSVIVQVVNDDGALLPCAINAACAALVDAGIPLKHLAVAICCCLADTGYVILDPTKQEEEKMKAFVYLVFPNSVLSVLPQGSSCTNGEAMENGIITSITHGAMSGKTITPWINLIGAREACRREMLPCAYTRPSLSPYALHACLGVKDYFHCLERGRAATAKLSSFLRGSLQTRLSSDLLGDS